MDVYVKLCKHMFTIKVPYTGDMCTECGCILVNKEVKKILTQKEMDYIRKKLGDHHRWVKWFDCPLEKKEDKCGHQRERYYDNVMCVKCGEVFTDETMTNFHPGRKSERPRCVDCERLEKCKRCKGKEKRREERGIGWFEPAERCDKGCIKCEDCQNAKRYNK